MWEGEGKEGREEGWEWKGLKEGLKWSWGLKEDWEWIWKGWKWNWGMIRVQVEVEVEHKGTI